MNDHTQLVVIGGGPGGYAAAFLAADLGMKVTLVNPEPNPGGVCLYRGCIPSKALLHVAKLISETRQAEKWGVQFGEPRIDLPKLRAWKEDVVQKLTGGLGMLTRQRKITYLQGYARFLDAHRLAVDLTNGNKKELTFEYAIIATGSRPAWIPGFPPPDERIMDSTAALELKDIPEKLLVVGGGYIGLELGSVYAALGSRVTVVEMLPGLLPGADRDLVRYLEKQLQRTFEAILLNTRVVQLKSTGKSVKVKLEGEKVTEKEQVFDRVLISVGRKPNSRGFGLENTRISVNEKGFIETDIQRRTAEPHIFAIGDVAGEPMLAHKASAEGRVAVEAIAGKKAAFEPAAIPAVVFTDPELAWAGLTETQAREEGIPVEVTRFPWAASGRALTLDQPEGLTKLVIDSRNERILGVGIVGSGAGELISEGALAIEMASLASDLKWTIHPHPTLSETLMEAAEMFFGQSTHVFRPKRK